MDAGDRSSWHPGYSVVAVSTVAMIATSPGQTLLLSLLNVPLRETFEMDAFTINAGYTAATIAASLPLVFLGTWTDRIGPRRMMVLVAIAFGLACGFMGAAASIPMVFIGFFLLRFLGQGSLSLVSGHAVAMWFHARLGKMEGLRSVVLFAAGAPLPALTHMSIERWGWRTTWAGFGVIVAVTVSSLAWRWLRDRPEDVGLGLDGMARSGDEHRPEPGMSLADAVRTRPYVLLASAAAIPPMVATAVIFDIEPLLTARGMSSQTAAFAVSSWSAAMAALALPAGALIDRSRPALLLFAGVVVLGCACASLTLVQTPSQTFAVMAMLALGHTLVGPTTQATAARFFGRRHHGAIRSSLSRLTIIATGLGPLAFGISQRVAGSLLPALLGFAALCVPVALAALWLRPPDATGPGVSGRDRRPP